MGPLFLWLDVVLLHILYDKYLIKEMLDLADVIFVLGK